EAESTPSVHHSTLRSERSPKLSPVFRKCFRPVFISSHHPDPRELHSFPTRRSSDLETAVQSLPNGIAKGATTPPPERVQALKVRSEEHTSELQSRFDLVCRLLLEKRKANIVSMHRILRPDRLEVRAIGVYAVDLDVF